MNLVSMPHTRSHTAAAFNNQLHLDTRPTQLPGGSLMRAMTGNRVHFLKGPLYVIFIGSTYVTLPVP